MRRTITPILDPMTCATPACAVVCLLYVSIPVQPPSLIHPRRLTALPTRIVRIFQRCSDPSAILAEAFRREIGLTAP
jgi:hypothetical protein